MGHFDQGISWGCYQDVTWMIHFQNHVSTWLEAGNPNTVATWREELTLWKRPWCWERLKAGGGEDNRGWDGWMASPTQWTWVWVNSGSWWWTGKPGMLQSMGSQRVRNDWATEWNWTEFYNISFYLQSYLYLSIFLLLLSIMHLLIPHLLYCCLLSNNPNRTA